MLIDVDKNTRTFVTQIVKTVFAHLGLKLRYDSTARTGLLIHEG